MSSPGGGQSWAASSAWAKQSAKGTANTTPDIWVPRKTNSAKGKLNLVPTGSPFGTRTVKRWLRGVREWAGSITMEAFPRSLTNIIKGWNGQVSSAALPGAPTSLSGTAASGGSLANGVYKTKVATWVTRSADSTRQILNPSNEASTTLSGSNGTINLSWTAAVSVPTGTVFGGYAIYATAVGGSANSEVLVKITSGSSTSYAYDGADTPKTSLDGVNACTPITALYQHLYVPAGPNAGYDALDFYTLIANQDNDKADQFSDGKVEKLGFATGSNQNDAISTSIDLKGIDFVDINAIGGVTYNIEDPVMFWATQLTIGGGTTDNIVEGWEWSGTNGLAYVPGATGRQTYRDLRTDAVRMITGTITRGYEDHVAWEMMRAGQRFALHMIADAQYTAATNDVTTGGNTYYGWRLGFLFDFPVCIYETGGGEQSEAKRMTNAMPFKVDSSDTNNAYDLQITAFTDQSSVA